MSASESQDRFYQLLRYARSHSQPERSRLLNRLALQV
jgi:hypothetical protein